MLALGMSDLITFFVVIGIFLIFAASWIIKSESSRNILKNEMRRLRSQIESYERDKFILLEKMDSADAVVANTTKEGPGKEKNDMLLLQALEQNTELEKEVKRLKAELNEAKNSLEEIYKAFVDKK